MALIKQSSLAKIRIENGASPLLTDRKWLEDEVSAYIQISREDVTIYCPF